MNAWTIYWILQLDSIRHIVFWLSIITLVSTGIIALVSNGEAVWVKGEGRFTAYFKFCIFFFLFTSFCVLLLPTTDTAKAMVLSPAIANSQNPDELRAVLGVIKQVEIAQKRNEQ